MKNDVIKRVQKSLVKNSPAILTGLGVAGVISTAVMAVQATPKALEIVEEEKQYLTVRHVQNAIIDDVVISKTDIVKLVWKCYIPTAIMGGVTMACILGANNVNTKRNATLAGLYSLTEKSLREYQAKVVETIGENKERKVRDDIMQDRLDNDPYHTKEVVITGAGEMLCYDTLSGRYFMNDIENIRRVQNDLNYELRSDMWLSLNDLYYGLGLAGIELGARVGWDVDNPLDIDFGSMLSKDNKPCLVLEYKIQPFTV